jgi:hypothetical protein
MVADCDGIAVASGILVSAAQMTLAPDFHAIFVFRRDNLPRPETPPILR